MPVTNGTQATFLPVRDDSADPTGKVRTMTDVARQEVPPCRPFHELPFMIFRASTVITVQCHKDPVEQFRRGRLRRRWL